MADIKLFEDKKVRAQWDAQQEDWLFSVADVCNVLAESEAKDKNSYWRKLKQRLKKEGSEVVTKCHGLKLTAEDGKKYITDVMYTKDVLRIVQSIPSKKAEPFKVWLAHVGAQRLDEIADPQIAIDRAVQLYREKGYPEEWITQRMMTIKVRKELTDEWQARGIIKEKDYAILTNEMTKAWSGLTVAEYKQLKGLHKENLRDNMTDIELVLNMLAEVTTTAYSKNEKPSTLSASKKVAARGGNVAKNAKLEIEQNLGQKVVSPLNATNKPSLKITKDSN